MAVFGVKEACEAATKCRALLMRDPAQAQEAWLVIEPYVSCTEIEGQFSLGNDELIQMLLALAADAKSELQEAEEAAFLYREAMQYDGSYAFADGYAMLVINEELAEHRGSALLALDLAERKWKSHSLLYRFVCHAGFILLSFKYPHGWFNYRRAKRAAKQLRDEAARDERPSAPR